MIFCSLACVLPHFKRTRQNVILWTAPGVCERPAPRRDVASPLYPNPDGDPLCEEHKVFARDHELWAARELFRRAAWNKTKLPEPDPVDLLCVYPLLINDKLVFCEALANESRVKRPLCEMHAFARDDKELWKELDVMLQTKWREGLRVAEEEHQEWMRAARALLARNPEPKPMRLGMRNLRREKRCVVPLCVRPRVEGDRCKVHGATHSAHLTKIRPSKGGAPTREARELRRLRTSHASTFTRLISELEELQGRKP